ncbi:MAG: DinB family protein [Clostridia bacterium]|nr:DinB family protein [Clostridia bacterium]
MSLTTGSAAEAHPGPAARREVEAQVDLHERALRAFIGTIADWTDETLEEPLAADPTWTGQTVLSHVVGCIYYGYFGWMQAKLGLPPVPMPVPEDEREGYAYFRTIGSIARWRELLAAAFPYVRAVAAGVTDADLTKEFTSGWGDRYSIDQMFEHATMHLWRHVRQIERDRLAKARGTSAASDRSAR